MKLLTQTGLLMVTLSLFLFFAFGVAFYFVFKAFTNQALNKDLEQAKIMVMNNPGQFYKAIGDGVTFFDKIEFIPAAESETAGRAFADSIIAAGDQKIPEPVRFIKFNASVGNENFIVKIYKSKISSDDLTVRITLLITLLALVFTIGILLLNRYGFKSTWKDFWMSLQKVQAFKAGADPPVFEPTEIEEFEALNKELAKMTRRISRDYHNLESFTSHTTHEFQTPLAVIRSKVELLMQSDNLTPAQLKEIRNIDKYAEQLSRLTQSLSLLFKIENQQFGEGEQVDLSQLISRHSDFLKEQAEFMNIDLDIDAEPKVEVRINPSLAEVLVINLIKNSITHNFRGGSIRIFLEPGKLEISNSGNPPEIEHNRIFDEFVKGKMSNGSGLGLAIVKRICDQYGIGLNYNYNNHIHSFILIFPS